MTIWIEIILRFRWVAAIVVATLLIHTLGLLGLGVYRAYEAYRLLIQGPEWTGSGRPGIRIAESIDALLFSLALLVLATGTASLFLARGGAADNRIPGWMRPQTLSELKLILWEAILIVLVVASLSSVIANFENPDWGLLILPSAILLLSLSLFLARRLGSER